MYRLLGIAAVAVGGYGLLYLDDGLTGYIGYSVLVAAGAYYLVK